MAETQAEKPAAESTKKSSAAPKQTQAVRSTKYGPGTTRSTTVTLPGGKKK